MLISHSQLSDDLFHMLSGIPDDFFFIQTDQLTVSHNYLSVFQSNMGGPVAADSQKSPALQYGRNVGESMINEISRSVSSTLWAASSRKPSAPISSRNSAGLFP